MVLGMIFLPGILFGQATVTGIVAERADNGRTTRIPGVNIFWLGTTRGTVTDSNGVFTLAAAPETRLLVIRHAGYLPDTVDTGTRMSLRIILTPVARQVDEVQIVGTRSGITVDYMNPRSTNIVHEKELFKAACCNLSESFETNPSVDVTFTDAITGIRQIEMLGLSGVYSQTTLENLPYLRGLTSNAGLTFIPGTWIQAINVSKGIGSVANGYESITGQIDVDLRKPSEEEESRLFINAFGTADQRIEGNLNVRQVLNDRWSTMTLAHASGQQMEVDDNGDGYLDMPRFNFMNLVQRLSFYDPAGWEGQIAVQYLVEGKRGGTPEDATAGAPAYRFTSSGEMLRVHGKTGLVFADTGYQSLGLQWSVNRYQNTSMYGTRVYDGDQRTAYLNLVYQSLLWSESHTFRTGASFLLDQINESFEGTVYQRTERVPGVFLEYTFTSEEMFTLVAGIRTDWHNAYGAMVTPRLHVRYAPSDDWVLRAMAGHGFRTASIFAENAASFASSRTTVILASGEYAYGLPRESAWNMGLNLTHYFTLDGRDATLSVDLHRTVFGTQVIADLDYSPQEVRFVGVTNGSYAHSVQAELNLQPLEGLETRLAYRFLDVRQNIGGDWRDRPFVARHRALFVASYTIDRDENETGRTILDATVQWFGRKRIPDTSPNPDGLRARSFSPEFATMNAQVSRRIWAGMDLYLGVENIFGFRQDDPVLDGAHPEGPYFDASLIWGPVTGRMVYAGLRYRL
jgi:outer membrane receptor for ferrienterochelin and colicin